MNLSLRRKASLFLVIFIMISINGMVLAIVTIQDTLPSTSFSLELLYSYRLDAENTIADDNAYSKIGVTK